MPRVLIVDDDPNICLTLRRMLEKVGLGQITVAQDGFDALAMLSTGRFDLCILDLGLPRLRGEAVLCLLRDKGIRTKIVVLTGEGTVENATEVMKLGACEFIQKGITTAKLMAAIQPLLAQHDSTPASLAQRLDTYLRDRYPLPNLHPGALCRHFRVSHSYLCRIFKDHFGTTCQQRLAHYRVEKAKELLRSTDLPLYLVADQCGFKSYAQFNRAFRTLGGMSAGEFRRTDSV